ncbi:hypothetical protein FRC09_020883 [Ceratobasidium sp. 395]|nr:hypothetical protein FRC09_020883 [Ceratobasidium sp. 395]
MFCVRSVLPGAKTRLHPSDSGGAGGLSAAALLDQLMKLIQSEEGLAEMPLVEEYFDIVAGAGTGAIVVTLVGRLGMTTEKALETFARLSNEVFSDRMIFGQGVFRASKMEQALKAIVREVTGNEDEPMLDQRSDRKACQTHNMNSGIPTIIRSYHTSVNPGPNCTIWQALRTATAHPEMFKSAEIVEQGIAEPFVDAAMGCGNPIDYVLAEAKRIYPNRRVACIVSIGSGHPRTIRIPEPSPFQRVLPTYVIPTSVIIAMRDIATDNERVAQAIATRFAGIPNVYFRVNVDQGMQSVRLGDWDRLGEVKAHTRAYMAKAETKGLMGQAAKAVKEKKGIAPVEQIDGKLQMTVIPQQAGVKQCPVPTSTYTERRKPVQKAIDCLTGGTSDRRVFVFHGLGGAGKTQLALQVVERTQEHWSDVIYIDATSADSLMSTLRAFAAARSIGATHEDALRSLGLQKYFPVGRHGRIMITTRSRDVVPLARGPSSDYNVSSMEPEESLQLLLAVARSDLATILSVQKKDATALVEDLGHLALAVVQAGAYIFQTSCSFCQYREIYRQRPHQVFRMDDELPVELSDYEKTVHTTWRMSYALLSEHAQRMLWLMAYLHRDRITQEIFERAASNMDAFEPMIALNDVDSEALSDVKSYLGSLLGSDGAWDLNCFLKTMTEIRSCLLISFDQINRPYELHPLVQGWIQTTIPHSPELALARSTLLLALSIDKQEGAQDYAFRRSLELHLNSTMQRKMQMQSGCAAVFGRVLFELGQYGLASTLQSQVVEATTSKLGREHPHTLWAVERLAYTHYFQHLYKQAELLQVQVLEGRKRILGDKHIDTLEVMEDLANTYCGQGLYKQAEVLHVQVLEERKQTLGVKHPKTLTAMSCLASVYSDQGLHKRAEPLLVQVLEERRQALGDNHPGTLHAMSNLSTTYYRRGLYKQAEALRVQVLEASKQVLGDKHPDTLVAMNNLATVYSSQGLWSQAEVLYVQSFRGRRELLGLHHPRTFTVMTNLAYIYKWLGSSRQDELNALKAEISQLDTEGSAELLQYLES